MLQAVPIRVVDSGVEACIASTPPSGLPPSPAAPRERSQLGQDQSAAVSSAKSTSGQLKRRAKIVDVVIDLIGEAGADAVQMRDVAQRSGVALATLYKYFSSKEELLAAALDSWQMGVAGPILGTDEVPDQDPVSAILDYQRRSLRVAHDCPEMTGFMLQLALSTDREAKIALDQKAPMNAKVLGRFLNGVAPEDLPHVTFALTSASTGAMIELLTGRMTLEQSLSHVEWVARVLLGEDSRGRETRPTAGPVRGSVK